MVGLVIVTHSARLAEGVAELARGMAGPDLPIAATGGLDLPDRPLGTDAVLVRQAIEQVYSDDGVVVLMDLGSAVMSAEMALDTFSPERRARIVLCEAPLVEGAIAAATQARIGSPLEQVLAEARGALIAKSTHLGETAALAPSSPLPPVGEGPGVRAELRLPIRNRLGLHARPAARFVQTAGRFKADVRVSNLATGRGPVSAKSINGVATLGARQGHEVLVTASGPDAEAALAALQSLADDNFGDRDTAGTPPAKDKAPRPDSTFDTRSEDSSFLQGLPASPGIAIGPARTYRPTLPDIPTHTIDDPSAEWRRLTAAIDKTRAQIEATRDDVARRADEEAAAIFDAHALFLDDEALREPARRTIFDEQLNAAVAWQAAINAAAEQFRALDDEYQRTRAADVIDVGWQVLLNLIGRSATGPAFAESGILVASDLSPADTASLDPKLVLGICTALGGPTSHSAILARSFGIPAAVGLGNAVLALQDGSTLILDGEAGQVFPNPDPDVLARYAQRANAARAAQAEAKAASAKPAITKDGHRVEIGANIGSTADAHAAVAEGAEGVGLFRTEFLFLDRQTAPTEDEQFEAYCAAAEAMRGRPIIIRTLDVGGDKPPSYLDLGHEANPFLGWRAIRICLAQPEFFKTQLRAIVRAAAQYPIKVMFPMIATLSEWRAARALLNEAKVEVVNRGQVVPDSIETGIMVEIPSAALRASQFAAEVDFFSIGTNDLTQYTLAAERGNAKVAALADPFHPAVLQLIQTVVEAAHAQGKWAGVCGEMGGDPLAVPLLVGLGVDELSMAAPAIPRAKQIIREMNYAEAGELAKGVLELETSQAVRDRVKQP